MLDEERAFREFEARYRREYRVFYEYLTCFYDMNVSEDSYFWSAMKVTNSPMTELESFVNLVGGVASGDTTLTNPSDVAAHWQDRSHEYQAAIDDLVSGHEQSMLPVFKSGVVQQAMESGMELTTQVMLGAGNPLLSQSPVFENGLLPTPDGLFWATPAPDGAR